jgi:predicted nucleotidyltransferase
MAVTPAELRRTLADRRSAARRSAEERREAAVRAVRGLCAELARSGVLARAWLVGSAAWGGFGERSDLDVVVRGLDVARRAEVQALLADGGRAPVDLLRWEELPDGFRDRVAREGVELS